jgi:hypothetical protein
MVQRRQGRHQELRRRRDEILALAILFIQEVDPRKLVQRRQGRHREKFLTLAILLTIKGVKEERLGNEDHLENDKRGQEVASLGRLPEEEEEHPEVDPMLVGQKMVMRLGPVCRLQREGF